VSFDSLLRHTVTIVRSFDDGTEDEYGQPETSQVVVATVRAAIQPRADREATLTTQAGVVVADHLIYLRPTDVTTADYVVHDPTTCDAPDDLAYERYEIVGTPNAAGIGHHLELDARLISSPVLDLGS